MRKMSKNCVILMLFVVGIGWGWSMDVIELKSGEVLEGRILREDEREVVLEYRVTETIWDERRVERGEIARIRKLPEDLQEFGKLEGLPLPTDALKPEDYDRYIGVHEKFLEKYAYSSKVREVRERLARARQEREVVAAGGAKVGGQLMSVAGLELVGVGRAALERLERLRDAAERNDHRAVVNLAAEWEKAEGESVLLPEVQRMALESARKFAKKLEMDIRNFTALETKWKESIERATENDRRRLQAMREEQQRAFAEELKQAKAAGERIPPVAMHDLKSLQEALKAVEKEAERLRNMGLDKRVESMRKTLEGAEAAAKERWEEARETVRLALELWPENRSAKGLQEKLTAEGER